MLKILFWNLNRKDLRSLVCEAVKAEDVDVVLLIESGVTRSEVLDSLQTEITDQFHIPNSIENRFQVFSKDRALDLSEFHDARRISLRKLKWAGLELSLGVVHLVDARNNDMEERQSQVEALSHELRRREERVGHQRTILIGDFNMNPFDRPMNLARGMNAMMTRKCVERGNRTSADGDYTFFYNPMWSLFGDGNPGPSGTYYHTGSSRGMFGWNMLDQVLLRPSVADLLESVRILDSIGTISLRTSLNRPTQSDHFPILLTLK